MKLLVVSDSHRETEHMLLAVRRERPDAVVHLGDHADDADAIEREFPYLPLCRVRGNCDYFENRAPEQALLRWEGVKLLAVHGHRYGVKGGLLRLQYAAKEKEAQVALFGHTHCAYCEELDGLWLLNPGACGSFMPTYGIVEIQEGAVECCVKEVYTEEDQ
ncbi:MAG: metallophosphoesterase family protein [Faecousia sp.]